MKTFINSVISDNRMSPQQRNFLRTCIFLFCLACGQLMNAQQAKGPVQLADEYFAAGEFYTAANLYGQYLNPSRKQKPASEFPLVSRRRRSSAGVVKQSNNEIRFKQAESYRLANYWNEAEQTYLACFEKDSTDYIDALYWAAVSQRSLGEYDKAIQNLNKYLLSGNRYKTEASNELKTLTFIRKELARADSVLVKMTKLNSIEGNSKGFFAVAPLGQNEFLVSSTAADTTVKVNPNPFHSRLYRVTANDFNNLKPLSMPGASNVNQGAGSLSPDGKTLYFSQWTTRQDGAASSIYQSRLENGTWSSPILVAGLNAAGSNNKQPFCTKDGKSIYFSSDRKGGAGKFDIWIGEIRPDGSIGNPVNAGPTVNTIADEQSPFFHTSSNTLVFASNGHQGMGGFDLFESSFNSGNWSQATNLGNPVNSSRDDLYFYAPENKPLLSEAIFSSDRGSGCCLESYTISKAAKKKIFLGTLLDCSNNEPIADAEVLIIDNNGKELKTKTAADGRYSFEATSIEHLRINFKKDLYRDSSTIFNIQQADESDLLVSKLQNTDRCIAKKPVFVIKPEDVVTLFFDFDKSILKPEAIRKLDSIYNVMVEYPSSTIQVSGYTDGRGTEAYNKILSDKRAKACADYLATKGIDWSRISFVSFGACCPVEMELINGRDNPDGRSRNRRALINVSKNLNNPNP